MAFGNLSISKLIFFFYCLFDVWFARHRCRHFHAVVSFYHLTIDFIIMGYTRLRTYTSHMSLYFIKWAHNTNHFSPSFKRIKMVYLLIRSCHSLAQFSYYYYVYCKKPRKKMCNFVSHNPALFHVVLLLLITESAVNVASKKKKKILSEARFWLNNYH